MDKMSYLLTQSNCEQTNKNKQTEALKWTTTKLSNNTNIHYLNYYLLLKHLIAFPCLST